VDVTVAVSPEGEAVAVAGALSVVETVRLSVSAIDTVVVPESESDSDVLREAVGERESETVAEKDFVAVLAERDTEGVAGMLSVIDRVALSVSAIEAVVEAVMVKLVEMVVEEESVRDPEDVCVDVAVTVLSEGDMDAVAGALSVVETVTLSVSTIDTVVVPESESDSDVLREAVCE
jgi:hypothetical protein